MSEFNNHTAGLPQDDIPTALRTPENTLILLASPYFDGVGMLYEVALEQLQAGHNVFVLDAIEPGLYPEIKNFTRNATLLWRTWRRRQFLSGLQNKANYTRLRRILHKTKRSHPQNRIDIDHIEAISRLVLHDHAICHAMSDADTPGFIEENVVSTISRLSHIRNALNIYLDSNQITNIYTFNGRNPVSRILEDIASASGIKVTFLEYFGKRDNHMTYVRVPFDIFDMDKLGEWIQRRYDQSDGNREDIAKATLEDRIVNLDPLLRSWNLQSGIDITDKEEITGKPIISFFFSSEDEYPALKQSRYGLPDPTRQFETFRSIVRALGARDLLDAYRWEMKLHPRYLVEAGKLAGAAKAWDEAIAFAQANGMNLKVHAPTTSPYGIIARSTLVISYGSTAWEACYLGKPAVLLGPGPFAAHGCTYDAQNVDAIINYIANIPAPLPQARAYPYAWAWNQLGDVPHAFRPISTVKGPWQRMRISLSNRFVPK